jgi:hypothetical protein
MSIIGKLAIVVVILLGVLLAFIDCAHSWREENDRRGKRWRCMDCGALTNDEPTTGES